jgi:hypothetical protein
MAEFSEVPPVASRRSLVKAESLLVYRNLGNMGLYPTRFL